MASEPVKHTEHAWRFYVHAAGDIVWQCEVCGQMRTCWQDARINLTELQLANVRAENATMRALLERLIQAGWFADEAGSAFRDTYAFLKGKEAAGE